MVKILIVDDHVLIREGLRKICTLESDLEVVGEASNAAETLETLSRIKSDVVILDVNMPGRSGIETLEDIRKRFPKIKVLMLSMHPEDTVAMRALKSGASGYVSKNAPPEELIKAIRKVAAGGRYVSEGVADRLAEELGRPRSDRPHESLSTREFEVLRLLGTSKTVGEIAKELSLSVSTVTTFRSRILQKLGLRTTAELIHYAIRHRLVEPLE